MNRNIPPPIRSVNNGYPQTKSVNLIIYSLIRSNIFYIVLCQFHNPFLTLECLITGNVFQQ